MLYTITPGSNNYPLGFLTDIKRMNVRFSRAKQRIVMVSDKSIANIPDIIPTEISFYPPGISSVAEMSPKTILMSISALFFVLSLLDTKQIHWTLTKDSGVAELVYQQPNSLVTSLVLP